MASSNKAPATVTLRWTGRDTIDLGTYPGHDGRPHRIALGSIDDAGAVGVLQPEGLFDGAAVRAALQTKAARALVEARRLYVHG